MGAARSKRNTGTFQMVCVLGHCGRENKEMAGHCDSIHYSTKLHLQGGALQAAGPGSGALCAPNTDYEVSGGCGLEGFHGR